MSRALLDISSKSDFVDSGRPVAAEQFEGDIGVIRSVIV
jgi:hypothetical protein